MIIKHRDPIKEKVIKLTALLKEEIKPAQRFLIERELRTMKTGAKGEKDSAYYIDFHFGNSKNWAVIHDLRIEHNNQVAQIDHLLINRVFNIYVLESKNFSYGIEINSEGEFQAIYDERSFGIPSPIEQNKRHIILLDSFLRTNNILSKRMGIAIKPKLMSYILVSPKSIITRPHKKKFDTGEVIKADSLRTSIDKEFDKITPLADIISISKASSTATIMEVAEKLASFHSPKSIDYRVKFGLSPRMSATPQVGTSPAQLESGPTKPTEYFCFKCQKLISDKEAKFCWSNKSNKAKFGGRAYCYECQKKF